MKTKWLIAENSEPKELELVSETAHFAKVRVQPWLHHGNDRITTQTIKKDGKLYDTFDDAKTAMVQAAAEHEALAREEWQRSINWLDKCTNLKSPNA